VPSWFIATPLIEHMTEFWILIYSVWNTLFYPIYSFTFSHILSHSGLPFHYWPAFSPTNRTLRLILGLDRCTWMLSSATQHSLSWLMQAVVATTPWDTRGTVPAQHKVRGITSVLAHTALIKVKVRGTRSVVAHMAVRSHLSESTRHYISSCAHGCEISYQWKYAVLHQFLCTWLWDLMLGKVRGITSVLAHMAVRSHVSESTRHYISSCAHGCCEISY
jgi:hypothetical protein